MQPHADLDRRHLPRYAGESFRADLRPKGQFSRIAARVLDFNRHGMALEIDRPLVKDQLVFLKLADGEETIERLVGVVHNCLGQVSGYRCGIRFRTQSALQFDRFDVEYRLAEMEQRLAELITG
jgi:hypothetical protein